MADRTERLLTRPIGVVTTSLQLLGDGHTVVLALSCRDQDAAREIYDQLGRDLITGAEPFLGTLRLGEPLPSHGPNAEGAGT